MGEDWTRCSTSTMNFVKKKKKEEPIKKEENGWKLKLCKEGILEHNKNGVYVCDNKIILNIFIV